MKVSLLLCSCVKMDYPAANVDHAVVVLHALGHGRGQLVGDLLVEEGVGDVEHLEFVALDDALEGVVDVSHQELDRERGL